jgi:hypothetical protein
MACLIDYQAVSVEDKLVLPPEQIAVSERNSVVFGPRTEHALAIETFARVIGRRREVDYKVRVAYERLQLGRPTGIPDIFTDIHAHARVAKVVDRASSSRLKVTLFVKDSVVRQESLMINIQQFSVRDDSRSVVDVRPVSVDKTYDYQLVGARFNHAVERAPVLAHKVRAEQKVFGRVGGNRKLRIGDYVCARCSRAIKVIEHLIGITLQISDGRIDLSQRYPDGIHKKRLSAVHFNGVNYADDCGVDRAFFTPESHARRAALDDQHGFVNARAYSIDCDDVPFFVLAVCVDKPRDQELAPVKAVILSRRYYGSDYACKKHIPASLLP